MFKWQKAQLSIISDYLITNGKKLTFMYNTFKTPNQNLQEPHRPNNVVGLFCYLINNSGTIVQWIVLVIQVSVHAALPPSGETSPILVMQLQIVNDFHYSFL